MLLNTPATAPVLSAKEKILKSFQEAQPEIPTTQKKKTTLKHLNRSNSTPLNFPSKGGKFKKTGATASVDAAVPSAPTEKSKNTT